MSKLTQNLTTSLFLAVALISSQVQAGMQLRTTEPESQAFSRLILKTKDWQTLLLLNVIFTQRGFNMTNDEKAGCKIELSGLVTVPSTTSGSVPIDLTSMLDNKSAFKEIGPALKSMSIDDVVSSASGLVGDPLTASSVMVFSQGGGAIGGTSGSIIGAGVGTLVNLVSGMTSRQETPPGLVYVRVRVIFGDVVSKIPVAAGMYIASTDAVKPERLFGATEWLIPKLIWNAKNKYNKEHNIEPYTPYLLASHTPVPVDSPIAKLTKKNFEDFVAANPTPSNIPSIPSTKSSVAPDSSVGSVEPVSSVKQSTGESARAVEDAK